ncbi:DUF5996 family protein [Staphylococcus canis]|uniref:Uncharacterized protein n=1 Tax=Staphylococcus canis TaxID=2724942 RepID=A0ABS0TAF9_9STAP|nr:DUF5996 family protein [Staphylococcus canis]MBI5975734.1 hypothetical protein [Staphylococcus canis]
MLKYKDWEKEKDTLHRIAQILGKHKLASAFQEPQWAHVILDITPNGFSTGMLFYKEHTYSIHVDLVLHRILVETDLGTNVIDLEDGKTIQQYYNEIQSSLEKFEIHVSINTKPQEVKNLTPFEEDTIHHFYDVEISRQALQLMKFATRALEFFVAPFRARKVKPGLFWGTFDISAIINYNTLHEMFKPSQVIEYAAFDEHFIEFGFWFGDDRFEGPTFYVLPYPFVDENFTFNQPLIEEAYFDKKLTELIYELPEMSQDTVKRINTFFNQGFQIFKDHLSWENCQYFEIPLKMNDNQIQQKPF